MTVEEMLERISSFEITGWRLLFEVKADEDERRSSMRKGGSNRTDSTGGGFFG